LNLKQKSYRGEAQRAMSRAKRKFAQNLREHNRKKPASREWRRTVARGKRSEDSNLPGYRAPYRGKDPRRGTVE